jgi:hypothetical protein
VRPTCLCRPLPVRAGVNIMKTADHPSQDSRRAFWLLAHIPWKTCSFERARLFDRRPRHADAPPQTPAYPLSRQRPTTSDTHRHPQTPADRKGLTLAQARAPAARLVVVTAATVAAAALTAQAAQQAAKLRRDRQLLVAAIAVAGEEVPHGAA